MSKNVIRYKCTQCDATSKSRKYFCPQCQSGEPYVPDEIEELESPKAGFKASKSTSPLRKASKLSELSAKEIKRFKTGINELDRVLGGGFVESEVVLFGASPGSGKALTSSTIIPTPDGFTTMGDIKIGDTVLDGEGDPTKVLRKFNPKVEKSYKIQFSNGEEVIACEDHLWELIDTEGNKKKRVISTKEIACLGVFVNEEKRWAVTIPNITGTSTGKTLVYIDSIEECESNEEFYCLMVESELHTFLCTEQHIPTHNSTLSLSISEKFAEAGKTVLYSSGEESEHQIALRAKRMGVDNDNIHVINETDLGKVLGYIDEIKPDFVVIDSLQTIASESIPGGIGSIQQSKEAAHTLTNLAKNRGIIMLLINQMTKE